MHLSLDSPRRPAPVSRSAPSSRRRANSKGSSVKRERSRAERVIAFIECLTVTSGEGAGGPFVLRDWQKRFIRDVYEPHIEKRRAVRRAILSIARKNGKTALIAALVLCHLIGPEATINGEIYSAANDREQAAQVFKVAAQMVRADPELLAMVKVVDSTKTIVCYRNGSFYKAMSAEAGTKHGLNPTLVIFDELAQAKSRELYDVLDTSMGARLEPLFITISTQSNDPEHILSKLIDDGLNAGDPTICVHLYAVPDECPDIFDPKVWKLANPALGDFRSAGDFKALADKAKRNPAEEPKFRNLFLNQRYSADTPLITRADWKACADGAELVDGEEIYLALDNASTTDLAALVAVSAKNGDRLGAWFWKPEALVEEHSRRDFGTGTRRYEEWAAAGWLELTPGRSIQPAFIVKRVAELASRYQVLGLAYDRWRIADFLRHLGEEGLTARVDEAGDGLRLVGWGQGFKDMAPAVDAFERAVLDGKLRHPGSPVLTWNVGNAVVITDPAGNRKLDKTKTRFRIDGAIATAMALGLKARDADQAPNISDFLSNPIVAMRRG